MTQEVHDLICEAIRNGNYRETAAEWVGVPMRTFFNWLRRGRKEPNSIFGRFLQAIQEAESAAEMKMVELVCKSALSDARHAQWWLERKFPKRWGSQKAEVRALERKIAELEKQLGTARSAAPAGAAVGTPGDDTLI